ncbi:cryptochrome/photolyase family protein [Corallincola holothuriorum]|uniref:Cryptochrome/photolyase family protein n=1 Tax=Corallincola holothuriorum TaxID=2282215 RepID=A0A368NKA7_9GAMM|nr:cryptochrome/photolyase family protein [Corallincola holothuriorum]RCU50576.1 cryptochrome/photolyase family protein [Corallincola holothuriorum]
MIDKALQSALERAQTYLSKRGELADQTQPSGPLLPTERIRLILGDQLNPSHSWYRSVDPGTLYLIAELKQEIGYVKHHIQKICAFFCAMAGFAKALKTAGHQVLHLTLDDTHAYESLPPLINDLLTFTGANGFEFQRPDEYRLKQQLETMQLPDGVSRTIWESEHFLLPFDELNHYFKADTAHRMETFYRKMRRRYELLMNGDEPEGGQWNYDANNREKLSQQEIEALPEPLCFANDVTDIKARLDKHKVEYFGSYHSALLWPVTRQQGLQLLDYFCQQLLPKFGRFQDAMTCQSETKWSLYHCRLSFAMNAKLLHPKQVIDAAITAYRQADGAITIAQVEGFVRQILGWREYVRGIYWLNMPQYAEKNALNGHRTLPKYFWDGETQMRCMRESLGQSLEYAYGHHIQRLMVIGNFALITGMDPDLVDAWYLGVYIDAIEWVEMPNTRGMSQFADGGLLASKPYAASGNYINKMSDYCANCHYQVKQKTGSKACPFNALYWHFMNEHRDRIARNPRIGMVYRNWDKMSDENRTAILSQAGTYLADLDSL